MLLGARVAVVVPAFNEAPFIEGVLHSVPAFVDDVIVVDDGSADGTAARAMASADPRVLVLRHRHNRGVGAAICTGYRAAFAQRADVAAVMAGDGQMHGPELQSLVEPLVNGQADYTKGNRLAFPRARCLMPWPRWAANHVLSLWTRWATGARVWDSQCGYTAMARRAFEQLEVGDVWPGYGYPNDLIAKVTCAGLRVRDVVVQPVYRNETSGIRWWHATLVVPYLLARAAIRRLLGRRTRLAATRLAADP